MKLGIVGNGLIVKQALECLKEANIEVCALWCRNEEKGKALQEQYSFTYYNDYQAFLEDTSFDTVYIGLVNSLHYEYAVQAIEAHKHVIVEKPFTSRYGETLDLIAAAEENDVMLFEAMMSRYSRNYDAILPHLDDIGDIKLIRCNYSQYSSRYPSYLERKVLPAFDPKYSGGALYDINVYNVAFVVGMFGAPRRIEYLANKGFNGIDTSGVLLLGYDAFQAVCVGAKDADSPSGVIIQGDEGYIEMNSRPGIVKNLTVHKKGKEPVCIDVKDEGNPMTNEFVRIQEIIDQDDRTQAAIWMIRTKQMMSVLDQARVSAGIHFAADDDESFNMDATI